MDSKPIEDAGVGKKHPARYLTVIPKTNPLLVSADFETYSMLGLDNYDRADSTACVILSCFSNHRSVHREIKAAPPLCITKI